MIFHNYPSLKKRHPIAISRLHGLARVLPLVTAILAPMSTLLDIPAVTQRWYALFGVPQPDVLASLILSIIGLFFNVIANTLLVVRFSTGNRWWRVATRLSTICWNVKTAVGVVNLIVFGALTRNDSGYSYLEGFWCAVVSVIISGTISIFLTFHWFMRYDADPGETDSKEVRLQGRHFMISVISLLGVVAIEALIFSRIEGWAYFDGIYFGVVSMLVIGFGDLKPTHTSTRILLFPFAIITITLLANQIGMIIKFFGARAQARKDRWRFQYEEKRQIAHDLKFPEPDLEREIKFLQEIHKKQDAMSSMYDLAWSLIGFLVFWVIGAALFHTLERWAYGTSLYFCYVFFLTIGYGDYTPATPAGRVVFVVYSLMSVPIITSFAVQTVTQIIAKLSERQLLKRKQNEGVGQPMPSNGELSRSESGFSSHAALVEQRHREWAEKVARMRLNDQEAEEQDFDRYLTDRVIRYAIELEERARHLLIENLPVGSEAGLLLKADRNVQLRNLKTLEEGDDGVKDNGDALSVGYIGKAPELEGLDTLEQVNVYRHTFAGLLAAASDLKGLKGVEMHRFERRRLEQQHNNEKRAGGGVSVDV